jgi:hypothetical protein
MVGGVNREQALVAALVSLMAWPRALHRSRAFWISVCNVIGLICSMVGVLLLFYYALPNEPPGGPIPLDTGSGGGTEWEAQKRLYDLYAHWGLWLVLLGTMLEAVPPICTAIGCWRWRTTPRRPANVKVVGSSPTPRDTSDGDAA